LKRYENQRTTLRPRVRNNSNFSIKRHPTGIFFGTTHCLPSQQLSLKSSPCSVWEKVHRYEKHVTGANFASGKQENAFESSQRYFCFMEANVASRTCFIVEPNHK